MDERDRSTKWVLSGFFFVSVAAHAAGWFVLGLAPVLDWIAERSQLVEIVAISEEPEPEPEPELPEPEPEPEVEPEPEPERPAPRPPPPPEPATPPPPPPPEYEEPPPVEEAIADFTGETITNDTGDATWATAVGSGAPMDGPIGAPGARVTGRRRTGELGAGAEGGTGTEPTEARVVALADLSRRPSPRGDMHAILLRNYPRRAQQLGIEGRVTVRFRINPDGTVARLRVRSEAPSDQGFGEACRRTVQQIGWEAPLARDGAAVATDATFECSFEVGL